MIDRLEHTSSRAVARRVNGQVLVIGNFAATGAASGVDKTLRTGQVYWFRDGRISALDGHYAVDDALHAVGLWE